MMKRDGDDMIVMNRVLGVEMMIWWYDDMIPVQWNERIKELLQYSGWWGMDSISCSMLLLSI